MKTFLTAVLFLTFALSGRCDFENYFEIKFNKVSIYNSNSAPDQLIQMEYDSIQDTDLMEIRYFECGISAKNDYELHIKVENMTVDLTFINDEPVFFLNMGWFSQFKNKIASVYLHHTKYTNGSGKESIYKIFDLLIS